MKTLFLLRHASAGNDPPGCSDHDRQLTAAGVREAGEVAQLLAQHSPAAALCSTARRAVETFAPIATGLPPETTVQTSRALYLASPDELADSIAEVDDECPSLLVVAHNPGVAQLANALVSAGDETTRSRMGRGFPPAALAVLGLELESWAELRPKAARLVAFVRPDDLD
jgi:phosphohistidine phosphatase